MAKVQQVLFQEIRCMVRQEVRIQVHERLDINPPKICHECRKRLSAIEAIMENTPVASSAIGSVEPLDTSSKSRRRTPRISGETVRKIRKSYGLTQKQMALILDITLTTVNRWERGKIIPSNPAKIKIAELRDMGKRKAIMLLKENSIAISTTEMENV